MFYYVKLVSNNFIHVIFYIIHIIKNVLIIVLQNMQAMIETSLW